MSSYLGKILTVVDHCWSNIRKFSYRNKTVFEIFFLILYSLEQVVLLLLTTFYIQFLAIIISLFTIIVLFTFSFHKLVMESRIRVLEDEVQSLQKDKEIISQEAEQLYNLYNELYDKLFKSNSLDINKEVKNDQS